MICKRKSHSKKAQSISINTIVVAAIALIVLVVIIVIFGTKIRDFVTGTRSCQVQGGECSPKCDETYAKDKGGGTYVNYPGTNCEDNKGTGASNLCCVPIIKPLGK